jgi:hypothetical protein
MSERNHHQSQRTFNFGTHTAGFEMAKQMARHVLFYLGEEVQTFFEIISRNWFAF